MRKHVLLSTLIRLDQAYYQIWVVLMTSLVSARTSLKR
jgi:hypothetical protein